MTLSCGSDARRAAVVGAIAAGIAASVPIALLSGFTVDDALVPARYAVSLARGEGYRPSALAPVSDGVTPLGFAHLLVPFAGGGVLAAHGAARALGVVAWIAGAAALGATITRLGGSRLRFAALLLLVTSAPLGGWAVAGLETGIVAAMVAWGLALREAGRGIAGALALGCAAGWRPELAPFVVVLAFAAGPGGVGGAGGDAAARASRTAVALAPLVLVALVRLVAFGRAAPLSSLAKAPVWSLGVSYAGAAALLAGLVAVAAPLGLVRAAPWTRALAAAIAAHVFAMAAAGGDWMPLARLAVPAAPAAILAAAHLVAAHDPARRWVPGGAPALVVAVALQLFGFVRSWPATHGIAADRRALIEDMRPVLADARVIAAIDVGWVGAAAEHARIVDLAGITDPAVAALGGGHTTRRIPRTLLDDRAVDAVILLLAPGEEAEVGAPWTGLRYARGTEVWIATMPGIEEELALVHVARDRPRYVVVARRPVTVAR